MSKAAGVAGVSGVTSDLYCVSLWDNGNVLDNIVVTQYMNIQKYSLICIILNDDFSYMNFISKIF